MPYGRTSQRIGETKVSFFKTATVGYALAPPPRRGAAPIKQNAALPLIGAAGRSDENLNKVCPPRQCRRKGNAAFAWSAPPPLPEGGANACCSVIVVQNYLGQRRS